MITAMMAGNAALNPHIHIAKNFIALVYLCHTFKLASNVTKHYYIIETRFFNLPTINRGGEMDKTLLG